PPGDAQLDTLSLHDALPISSKGNAVRFEVSSCSCSSPGSCETVLTTVTSTTITTRAERARANKWRCGSQLFRSGRPERCACPVRSEEHTSELQSRFELVCRL